MQSSLNCLTEDGVLSVQPLRWRERDEELRPVRVGAGVGHGEDAGTLKKHNVLSL